jgi:AraC-like DNA-binding protein
MQDQSHFTRDFKKTHGLTPSQYREEYLSPSHNRRRRLS